MKKLKLFGIVLSSFLTLGVISSAAIISARGEFVSKAEAFAPYTNGDGATYYNGISSSLSGTSLKEALYNLNNQKRQKTVGYKAMLNNPSQGFYVTDPGNGSNTITSFYSGNSINGTSGLNREHMWPNSRGGSAIEDDIHHTRPTLNAENGSRGNSFYVEGKKSSSGGWDPAMESFGDETYRGDSARIIFYAAMAVPSFKLVDLENDSTGNKSMGKLSDLLKWNLEYPVLQREKTRNEGAESLQGNRNPFIDHPEYACKIWGDTNASTREICKGGYTPDPSGDSSSSDSSSSSSSSVDVEETPVSSINVNATYKLGLYQKTLGKQLYADGEFQNIYYGRLIEDKNEAADVKLETNGSNYNIKIIKANGSSVYLGGIHILGDDNKYHNDITMSNIEFAWTWDSQNKTFKCTLEGTNLFLGSSGTHDTYTLLEFSKIAENDTNPVHLYATDGGQGGGDQDDSSSSDSSSTDSSTSTPIDSSTSEGGKKGGGGCSATINSNNSSLIFFTAVGALFVALRMRFKKKQD